MQEKGIIELLLYKDEKGIDELMLNYGSLMKYIIAPILKDPQDREDCLSEVTMKVWEKAELFDAKRGSWNAWLTTVTRNTALNYTRKLSEHNSLDDIKDSVPSTEPTPEEAVIQKECRMEIEKALNALSNKDRLLFYRKYYYLQSTAQIASELGMTERAVEGRLYRLKKKLRRSLGGETNE